MRIICKCSVGATVVLLGAGFLPIALADTPADPGATAPAAATAAPATTSTTVAAASSTAAAAPRATQHAATSAAESDAVMEKRLTNNGYKPKMRNGQKVWCKREGELGSRLGGQEVCGTPDELRLNAQQQQDAVKSVQKLYNATLK